MKTNLNQSLSGLPIREKVRRFYDVGSPYYINIFGTNIHDGYYVTGKESREEAQENLIKFLVDKAEIKRGSKILDVGCGVGGSSIWLARNLEARTTGITISPVQLEIARKLAQEQKVDSSFLLMNAEEMNFSEPFDVIWVVAALTHFNNQKHFLKLTSQFLKENGKLIIYDWMVGEDILDISSDSEVQPVIGGMVLANMYSNSVYLRWLAQDGYNIVYNADITRETIKTWEFNTSLIRRPLFGEIFSAFRKGEIKEIRIFLNGRNAIRKAMLRGKVKSFVIVAEKR